MGKNTKQHKTETTKQKTRQSNAGKITKRAENKYISKDEKGRTLSTGNETAKQQKIALIKNHTKKAPPEAQKQQKINDIKKITRDNRPIDKRATNKKKQNK